MNTEKLEKALSIIAVDVITDSEIYLDYLCKGLKLKTHYSNDGFDLYTESKKGQDLSLVIVNAINDVNENGDDEEFDYVVKIWEETKRLVDERISKLKTDNK